MKYEFHRVFFPWSWELTSRASTKFTNDTTKEVFRIFTSQILPSELLAAPLAANKFTIDLVNFKGREPGEIVLEDESNDKSNLEPAREHELIAISGRLQDSKANDPRFTVQLNTPFQEFRGCDLVFRSINSVVGEIPAWALLGSLVNGIDFEITVLRLGATRYRRRFGSSWLGVSPVIEEQILIDAWQDKLAIEYRCFNLSKKELPQAAWIHPFAELQFWQ